MAVSRALPISKVYKKKFEFFKLNGEWEKLLYRLEKKGSLLIYGREKNGKTWFTIMLAEMLSRQERVLYISAEEGISPDLQDTMKRVGISETNRMLFSEYLTIDEIVAKLKTRKCPKVVIVDNLTMYQDKGINPKIRDIITSTSDKLIIWIAHEDRNKPSPAVALSIVSRLAKKIVRINGLAGFVENRGAGGGAFTINTETAKIYHGNSITDKTPVNV